MALTREQIRIYNANARKRGLTPIKDDAPNNLDTFTNLYDEVLPYTTGLSTPVTTYRNADGSINTDDFEKNVQDNLNDISTATQYLFNAIDAAKDGYDQAVQAGKDAEAAQETANDAYDKALANAQEIVTLHDDIDKINIDIGDIDSTITGIQTQVTTNTGSITSLTGTVTTQGQEIDANTAGVQNYYDVWGVKDNTGGMVRGAAFISNESSPGDAAFVVDANFAVVNGDTKTPVLTIDASSGELVFNGTVPGLSDAISEAEAAQKAADQAQTDAINALNNAALTGSITKVMGSDGGTVTITIYDNKTAARQISLLPCIASGIGSSDQHSLSLSVALNGSTLFDKKIELGGYQMGGQAGVLVYSHSFTMNPGAGNQVYTVTMGGGGLDVKEFGNVTVLATPNTANDFG